MDKNKAGYIEGTVSIVVNSALFGLKLWAGIVTGSIALTADAWHTLSDSLSSMAVIVATKLSLKKPDREHPFGHGRWEQIAALFIAFLLAVVAWDFLRGSIERFSQHESVNFGTIAIAVTLASILVKEALAQYAFRLARRTGNVSIKADGWHHRTDALSSIVVLAGILFARHFYWIDSVLGIIISLMLFYASWEIVKEAVVKLLGEEVGEELIGKIADSVRAACPDDLHLHHFHIHNYVSHQELTLHIKLDKSLSIEVGHRIATEVENIIKADFGIVATVHVEPLDFEHRTD